MKITDIPDKSTQQQHKPKEFPKPTGFPKGTTFTIPKPENPFYYQPEKPFYYHNLPLLQGEHETIQTRPSLLNRIKNLFDSIKTGGESSVLQRTSSFPIDRKKLDNLIETIEKLNEKLSNRKLEKKLDKLDKRLKSIEEKLESLETILS